MDWFLFGRDLLHEKVKVGGHLCFITVFSFIRMLEVNSRNVFHATIAKKILRPSKEITQNWTMAKNFEI